MAERATLVRPPRADPSKSIIENTLELTALSDLGPDIFTNTRPQWHPPGARGVFGGAVIAQCLSAAQRTVAPEFLIHSMHCYFVLAGDADIPLLYYVERVREGRSFATRTVQARQRGRCVFTTTLSFVREGSGGKKALRHAVSMPDVPSPDHNPLDEEDAGSKSERPFDSRRMPIFNSTSTRAEDKKIRQWIKVNGTISKSGGLSEHLTALAYVSDSYFIGTVSRVHKLWRLPAIKEGHDNQSFRDLQKRYMETDGIKVDDVEARKLPEIGMMVSLDHSIYFHDPKGFRADEWMLTEMDSPWTNHGRGLVMQRIFTKGGNLIATCVQEGLARLKQDDEGETSSKSKL